MNIYIVFFNSGKGLPPPSFGQCPKENIFFSVRCSLSTIDLLGPGQHWWWWWWCWWQLTMMMITTCASSLVEWWQFSTLATLIVAFDTLVKCWWCFLLWCWCCFWCWHCIWLPKLKIINVVSVINIIITDINYNHQYKLLSPIWIIMA